jgi:hypothetical protein
VANSRYFKYGLVLRQVAELHVYSKGGHGFGKQKRNLPVDSWIEKFGD